MDDTQSDATSCSTPRPKRATTKISPKQTKKIAVLSGGGARGLIQVSCIAELQKAGKKDFSSYDLIVGSSAGAINGTILALKVMNPEQLLFIYPEMLDTIFKKKLFHFVPVYDRKNFLECWTKYIQSGTRLKDCKIWMVLSSVDVCSDTTRFFKSWEDMDGNMPAAEAVMRSFAAPYYFGQINDPPEQKVWYDGGCGSYNIPIDFGWTEALIQNWVGNYNIEIDAYGTGFSNTDIPFSRASKQGFLSQVWNFLFPSEGGMARAQSRLDQVRRMTKIATCTPGVTFEYYDIEIPANLDKMDDITHQKEYIEFGKRMAVGPLVSK